MRLFACIALSAGWTGCLCSPPQSVSKLTEERDRLSAEKTRLEGSLNAALNARWALPSGLGSGLVLAVPNGLVEDVMAQTLAEGVNGLSLRIKNLAVHVEDELTVKLLVVKIELGEFELNLLLRDVSGLVEAGRSRASVGDGRVHLEAPLKVVGGRGSAWIRFQWRGIGVTHAVCGDLDVAMEVDGRLAPLELMFRGSAFPSVEGAEFVIKPAIPAHRFELVIEPSDESWAKVQQLLPQLRTSCRMALEKVQALDKLKALLAKGIPVTVHTERLKTFRLPLAVTKQSTIDHHTLTFTASPEHLTIGKDYTWFGSSFRVSADRVRDTSAGYSLIHFCNLSREDGGASSGFF